MATNEKEKDTRDAAAAAAAATTMTAEQGTKRKLNPGSESSAALRRRIEETSADKGSIATIDFSDLPRPVAEKVGRTWAVVTQHCGSGMCVMYSLFSRKSDLDFFNGREAYGCAPDFDQYGYVPLLSLEEALYFLRPLLVLQKPKVDSPTWVCYDCETTYPKTIAECPECEVTISDVEAEDEAQAENEAEEWYTEQVQGAFSTYEKWKETATKADTAKLFLDKDGLCELEKVILELDDKNICFVMKSDDFDVVQKALCEANATGKCDEWSGPLEGDQCDDGPYTGEDFVGEENIEKMEEEFELKSLE